MKDLPQWWQVPCSLSPVPQGLGELLSVRVAPLHVVGQDGFRWWQRTMVTTCSPLGGGSKRQKKMQMQVWR